MCHVTDDRLSARVDVDMFDHHFGMLSRCSHHRDHVASCGTVNPCASIRASVQRFEQRASSSRAPAVGLRRCSDSEPRHFCFEQHECGDHDLLDVTKLSPVGGDHHQEDPTLNRPSKDLLTIPGQGLRVFSDHRRQSWLRR
jgi:hypothetical protein